MNDRPERHIRRIEVSTMIGSGISGAVLLPFGGTPARMALFLFGWAGGCALHLATQAAHKLASRRNRR